MGVYNSDSRSDSSKNVEEFKLLKYTYMYIEPTYLVDIATLRHLVSGSVFFQRWWGIHGLRIKNYLSIYDSGINNKTFYSDKSQCRKLKYLQTKQKQKIWRKTWSG